MDIYEALYTTRTMRRMRPDPIPLGTQARILDAAIRAPNGGNTQRWHFLAVDDPALKRSLGELYRRGREKEHEEFRTGTMAAPAPAWIPPRTPTRCVASSARATTWPIISTRHRYCSLFSRSTTTAVPTSFPPSGARCWPPAPKASAVP